MELYKDGRIHGEIRLSPMQSNKESPQLGGSRKSECDGGSEEKLLWWRILHDGLPVAENLRRRNIKVDSSCQMCGDYPESQYHMMFQCRVTREICSLAPTSFKWDAEAMDDTPQSIDKLITLAKQDRRELLNFYIGWRVWKKGNNIVFNQKREHKVKVIHDAIRDWNQWEEANNCLNQRNTENERSNDEAIQCHQTTPSSAQYYCQVDASWKNSLEVAGIGWSLHSMQGNQLLQGSTSIRATNSPREAEAEALRIAVTQMRALAFDNG